MLARLIALLAMGEAGLVKRRVKTVAIGYAAAGIAAAVALLFLILAGYLAAALRWGAIEAALWFGAGFLVLTVLILVVYRSVAAAQRREQQRKRAADTSMLAGASAMAMLPALLGRKGGVAALLVGLAGLAGYAAYREFQRGTDEDPHED